MIWKNFNNFGIGAIAIATTLNYHNSLSLPKILLILPLIIHKESLAFFSHQGVTVRNIVGVITARPELFFNFDKRYEANLVNSLNAIQFLIELGWVDHSGGLINLRKTLEIDESFGVRCKKIALAAEKISYLLTSSDEELYLNLRIKL